MEGQPRWFRKAGKVTVDVEVPMGRGKRSPRGPKGRKRNAAERIWKLLLQEESRIRRLREQRLASEARASEVHKPGYIDRVMAASDDVELLMYRALRLVVLLDLLIMGLFLVAVAVLLPLAIQTVRISNVGIAVGGSVTFLGGAGTVVWHLISRKKNQD